MYRPWLPIVALLLAACAPLAPDVKRIEGSPVFPAAATLPEVLQTAPTRSYVRLGVVDAQGVPGMAEAQVVARIRLEAQQMGADAVILQDVSTRAAVESKFNPATGGFTVTQGEPIPSYKGYAIKYR